MSTWEALKRILKTYQKMTLASSEDKHKKMQLSEAKSHKAYQKLLIQKMCWKHKVLISAVIAVSLEEYSLLLMIGIHHLLTNLNWRIVIYSTTALSSRIMTLVLFCTNYYWNYSKNKSCYSVKFYLAQNHLKYNLISFENSRH
jgi:hypothetical protein